MPIAQVNAPLEEVRPRRILPDLRVTEVTVSDEAVAIRVTQRRAAKKGGKPMLHEHANSSDQPAEAAAPPVTGTEPSRVEPAEFVRDVLVSEASTDSLVIDQSIPATVGPAAITAPQTTTHRVWRSQRHAHELPRGERWKRRRLPEVCW